MSTNKMTLQPKNIWFAAFVAIVCGSSISAVVAYQSYPTIRPSNQLQYMSEKLDGEVAAMGPAHAFLWNAWKLCMTKPKADKSECKREVNSQAARSQLSPQIVLSALDDLGLR